MPTRPDAAAELLHPGSDVSHRERNRDAKYQQTVLL
jgi:hypothetical protein